MPQEVQFELDLEAQRFSRSLEGLIRSARLLDNELKDIIKTGGQLDAKLGTGFKVAVKVDTSDLDRAEGKVKGLEGQSPKVTVQTDTTSLDKVEGKIAAIDGQSPKVTVQADSTALDRVKPEIKQIDGQSPKVTVQADKSDLEKVKNELSTIKQLAVIDIVMNLPGKVGGAAGFITSLPVISTINDQQSAARLLEARSPDSAGAAGAVEQAYLSGFGESRLELANVAAQIEQAGASAEEALLPVLQVATSQGQEVSEVFTAMSRLVTSGLVPDFQTAANVMTVGFQQGADAGGDFLDTIREYSSQFAEAGFSAEEMLGVLSSGLAEGAFNADKLADAVKESVNIRVREAVQDPESAPAQALTRLGQYDEAQAFADGQLSGAAFLEGLIAAAEEKGSAFDLFEVMGGAGEDLTTAVLQDIDWSGLEIPEGVAATAAADFADTLGNDLKVLTREFEAGLVGAVKVGGKSLTDWIKTAREQVQTLTEEISNGTALPEALEIALEAPGLADRIRDLEAGLGNFIIEFQLAVASVLEFLNQGEAAKTIRTAVADQAANQFEYEIKFADNPEEIQQAVSTAISRGVDGAALGESVNQVAAELIASGMEQQASALVEQIRSLGQGVMVEVTQVGLYGGAKQWETITVPVDPELTPEAAEEYARQVALVSDEALNLQATTTPGFGGVAVSDVEFLPKIDLDAAQAAVDAAILDAEEIAVLKGAWDALTSLTGDLVVTSDVKTGERGLGFENLIDFTTASGEVVRFKDATLLDFNATTEGVSVAVETMANDTEAAFGEMAFASDRSVADVNAASALLLADLQTNGPAVVAELDAITTAYEGIGQAAYDAWVATGGSEGSYPNGVPGRASGGDVAAGQPYKVGERGVELFVPGMDGSIIPNGLTQILLGLQAGGGSAVTNNYVTLNNQINAQGMSGALNAGRATADRMRGMF